MTIHPKTSGAAVGTSLGIVIVAILHSISGVHLTPEAFAAIPAFLGTLGSWLIPSGPTTVTQVTRNQPAQPPTQPPPAA